MSSTPPWAPTTTSPGQVAGDSATTAPANGPLKASLVPGHLIPLFTGAASRSGCGLTPALLAAQSQVESGYQVDAISSAGAVGIMQFLPSTWTTYGIDGIDGDHDGVVSILDPADAIYSATGYGNYICLQATTVLSTCYAHLATITVTPGQTVNAWQLGAEGETGDATGPHLHFEVRLDGQTVDPAPYLP